MREQGGENSSVMARVREIKRGLLAEVIRLLEKDYEMDMNLADKIVAGYFREGFLPGYYFLSTGAGEIAGHVFITTQILNANTESIVHESGDGKALTYFVNVGRDFPGKLARVIEENLAMEIVSYNSVKTESGIRIMTLEKSGRAALPPADEDRAFMDAALRDIRESGSPHAERFLESLPLNYLNKEVNLARAKPRIRRHLELFGRAMGAPGTVTLVEEASGGGECLGYDCEVRVSIAARNPGPRFVLDALRVFERAGVNLVRSNYDTFRAREGADSVAILTLYTLDGRGLDPIAAELGSSGSGTLSDREISESLLAKELGDIMRALAAGDESRGPLERLRTLARRNADEGSGPEPGNFLLNAVTDFFQAAEFLGIAGNDGIMSDMLRFESLGEFYVMSRSDRRGGNIPGYRFAHNSLRGPHKGGLRLDPIVRFDEVCALSFMMTWKTARTRVLFGGAKGGLVIRPADFAGKRLDFTDTLANFGRSLFLLTGPLRDVPAGDVGCGAEEIGILFEGFKSALRDLVLVAHGIKKGVTLIGHRVIPLEDARAMLRDHFDVDWTDRRVLEELASSERYLELVAAAQITGKPRMGIAARTGATGRGLLYGALATITRLFLEGRWEAAGKIDAKGMELLRKAAAFDEEAQFARPREGMVSAAEWEELMGGVFPDLLEGKKIVVQGTGNVGGALLKELKPFGVNLVAVSDAGGAVIGERLDIDEIVREAGSSPGKTCIGAKRNVTRRIEGAAPGAAALEVECDILFPCALENVITGEVAARVRARLVASGGNGTTTSRGERVLHARGIAVLYDFLANSGGVIASYFEWLRNLAERFRYEAETIRARAFDIDDMDPYVMPAYRDRIKGILAAPESPGSTEEWNAVIRDIIFCAVNEDSRFAAGRGVPVKTAGFARAILALLAARYAELDGAARASFLDGLGETARGLIGPHLRHPEVALLEARRRRPPGRGTR
ncbi:MAG: Glu/Leu/Phe/Val dehydrogenase [Spirochaetes bacterium]|nr:MAG: Glu/Leu/Phe/Val dehydrogenase [Spirochaetota bacterium]